MKAEIKAKVKDAMKAKDKPALNTLRALLTAIQYKEVEKNVDELPEAEIISILQLELKKRKESLEFEEKAGREEEKGILNREIEVVKSFLPEEITEEKLKELITGFIADNEGANMGQVMQFLKGNYSGQYDGKLASGLVKSLL